MSEDDVSKVKVIRDKSPCRLVPNNEADSEILKELVKTRGIIKGRLTKLSNYVNSVTSEQLTNQKRIDLRLRIQGATSLFTEFSDLQTTIEKTVRECDLDAQLTQRELFEDSYYGLLALAECKLSSCEVTDSSKVSSNQLQSIRLPTISMPVYSGAPENWLEYRDSFLSLVHNSNEISDIQKFHYLKSSLKGSAALVIDSVEFSASNYSVAWELLLNRYNNSSLLVHNHVKALFTIQKLSKESPHLLRRLIDIILKNLRALKILGEPTEHWDTLIIYIITSKLDDITEREWEQYKCTIHKYNNDSKSSLKVDDMLTFLRDRADMLETLLVSHNKFNHDVKNTPPVYNPRTSHNTSHNRVHCNVSTNKPEQGRNTISKKPCLMCNADHSLYACQRFLDSNLDSKLQFITLNKLCENCLRSGHTIDTCKFGPCRKCNKKHNTLIHRDTSDDRQVLSLHSADIGCAPNASRPCPSAPALPVDSIPMQIPSSQVSLQGGGKACLVFFTRISHLCDYFMDNMGDLKRKPFSISEVAIFDRKNMPEALNKLRPVAPNRWVLRGRFHEGDARFPEEHRNKQATPMSMAAIAMAHVVEPPSWTTDDIDEILIRGDVLYQNTMEHLEKIGVSLDTPKIEEEAGEESVEVPSGTLAAADVLNKFKVSDFDCIETDVQDSLYTGQLNPEKGSEVLSLKDSLKNLFKEYNYAVLTARGGSAAVWQDDDHFYLFDPHGCDDNGTPSDEPTAAAALICMKKNVNELTDVILGNLAPGVDDSFNLSPVMVTALKLNPEIGAPETKLENKQFEWINKGTAAIMLGPRGENSALGKAATKASIGNEDMSGRILALPAAAAFVAAAESVPPPHMHQDHMYNCLEAGTEYYLNHVKKTGQKDILPEDLTDKFEMGANTFSIELGEPIRLPLKLPDEPVPEGEEEEAEVGEEEEREPPMKQIKDALFKQWYDHTKPASVSLLIGDYHQLGVWLTPGGKVVAFDPAPTMTKGMLTAQRIKKGDEIRLQRMKDEMTGEGGSADDEEDEEDEEAGAEGEEVPEVIPEFVPPEACSALMVFSSPGEFIDKLTRQGPLDKKQCLAPYKLYPVTVTNELTSLVKAKRPQVTRENDEGGAGDEEEEEALVDPLDDTAMGKHFTSLGRTVASLRGRVGQGENYFMDQPNRDNQDAANSIMGIVVDHIEPYATWKPQLIDAILKYGDRLYTSSIHKASAAPKLKPEEVAKEFHVTSFNVKLDIEPDVSVGDVKAGQAGAVLNLRRGLKKFFESNKYGVLCAKHYCIGIWRASDDKAFCMWDPHFVGPTGRTSPGGAAALVVFSTIEELADTFKSNVDGLGRPGPNNFSISSVKVVWEISKLPNTVPPQAQVPDEGYENKVLTAYVETARGRTILRGTRPPDLVRFTRDALLQSSCAAIVSACMTFVRRPHLWTRNTVDEIMAVACQLFTSSLSSLGYEFRPGEDVLLPLQVLKRFVLGVNYVRYDLESVFSGKLEQKEPTEMTVRCALERFFESHTHGILWSMPHAVAVWRVAGSPAFYMMEPHACGPTGLRIDAQDDGAACVLTFTSAKLMAFAYLQNIPVTERLKHDFHLYAISVVVQPIKPLGGLEPPLVRAPSGIRVVPATSKVGIDGTKRRANESDRKHPPGSATCMDAQRASENRDKKENQLKGQRNTSGWLVLNDGTQYLSAQHSMACKKFPYASRGNQALACSVMAVAMSRVENICRWSSSTLDQILESGDQLYQDSYLHYRPASRILSIQQILRKFYTLGYGNCVCRVVVYDARQKGTVVSDLLDQLTEFFREERSGVFVAGHGDFAVALFRTPRGYYMFDPADRDRYGRAVAPACRGRARACFSQYPNVKTLAEKLGSNIPPLFKKPTEDQREVHFEEPASFEIYGMDVTSLRRLNQHER